MIGLISAVSLSIHHLKHNYNNHDDDLDGPDDADDDDAYDDPYGDADISCLSDNPPLTEAKRTGKAKKWKWSWKMENFDIFYW